MAETEANIFGNSQISPGRPEEFTRRLCTHGREYFSYLGRYMTRATISDR
ncbi:hypothetical protein Scep_027553 [Stephania cephalantha]|uniref:Uncharacterized protein n=1 Tax=Stephania cephalantha TaxID=152367 RepID=A0AAP0HL74_9MAGN